MLSKSSRQPVVGAAVEVQRVEMPMRHDVGSSLCDCHDTSDADGDVLEWDLPGRRGAAARKVRGRVR
jgi:hypothetical protein